MKLLLPAIALLISLNGCESGEHKPEVQPIGYTVEHGAVNRMDFDTLMPISGGHSFQSSVLKCVDSNGKVMGKSGNN